MSLAYVNGQYLPAEDATVAMEDRGHQFGDGVYEVVAFFNHKLLDGIAHLQRLERSLASARLPNPHSQGEWLHLLQQMIEENDLKNGNIYLQVTRGTSPRNHLFSQDMEVSITMSVFGEKTPATEVVEKGFKAIIRPDLRWKRCDIKSLNLLPNLLARQEAADEGAYEALLVKENGEITEGSVTNFFAVMDGKLFTHPANHEVLGGVTRLAVIALAEAAGIVVEESPLTVEQLRDQAEEAFITNTTSNLMPIVQVDDWKVGDGKPGKVTHALREAYIHHIEQQTGYRLCS